MSFAPMYAAATTGIPHRYAGLASGLITTSQQMGGARGLAVISGTAASVTASLTRDAAPQALTTGYAIGLAVSAAFTLLAVLLAVIVIRQPKPAAKPVPSATNGAVHTPLGR
jgi:hypothetical protein